MNSANASSSISARNFYSATKAASGAIQLGVTRKIVIRKMSDLLQRLIAAP